jgi:hypothetical protein
MFENEVVYHFLESTEVLPSHFSEYLKKLFTETVFQWCVYVGGGGVASGADVPDETVHWAEKNGYCKLKKSEFPRNKF